MTESLAVPAAPPAAHHRSAVLAPRRKLQLALAVLWLLDAVLQYQPAMFTRSFPQMLAASAEGNPAAVATPITWSATLIAHHLTALNTAFATIQLLLGLGIAYRPTLKPALAASVAWSLAVWWLGEGLGGVLTGTATPLTGAPGAVILYALLAVLLWPADNHDAPFPAARAIGRRPAQATWLLVWGSLAAFTLLPASPSTGDMPSAEPAWLTWLHTHAATILAHQPVLAATLVIVALGIYLPTRSIRPILVLALAVAALLWLAQGLGDLFTGTATDPDSAPLLALLALAFWPAASAPKEP